MAYENRDYTHLSESEKKNINMIAKAIRNKAYGIDVRESIALAIELLLDIFSKENNDAVAEIIKARNEFGTLDERLDTLTEILGNKIAKGNVDWSDITQEVREIMLGNQPMPIVGVDSVGRSNVQFKSLGPEHMKEVKWKNMFNVKTAKPNTSIWGSDGKEHDETGKTASDYIPVIPGKSYVVSPAPLSSVNVVFFDKSFTKISFTATSSGTKVTAPDSAYWLKANFESVDASNAFVIPFENFKGKYEPYGAYFEWSENLLKDTTDYIERKIDNNKVINGSSINYTFNQNDFEKGYYWSIGGKIKADFEGQVWQASKRTFKVLPGEEVRLYNWGELNNTAARIVLVQFNETGSTIVRDTTFSKNSDNSYSYIIPVGVTEIGLNMYYASGNEVSATNARWQSNNVSLTSTFTTAFQNSNLASDANKVLTGKKLLALGDSITARNWYQPMLTSDLGLDVISYWLSGSTITKLSAGDTNDFNTRSRSMQTTADYVQIWGGVNDFGYNFGSNGGVTLGTIDDTSDFTFYGAMNNLVDYLTKTYKGAKIYFIITTPISKDTKYTYGGGSLANAKGLYLDDYLNAQREVLEKYHIPYLDLQKNAGFNQNNIDVMTSNADGTSPDGLHPSMTGFNFIRNKLTSFIEKL